MQRDASHARIAEEACTLPPPWLSVIVPTHEGERWLDETLGSIAAETDAGIETIVIDSSPTDATLALVSRFRDRLRLRVLKRPDLADWRVKTNYGFSIARADHVSMLHQDDLWLPGRAAAVRRWIAAEPVAGLHLHPAALIDGTGNRLGALRCPLPTGLVPATLFLQRLVVQNFVAVPTPVIRRDAFSAVGGIDPTLWYTGDWDLYLKLAGQAPVIYHRDQLAAFRIHGHSLTVSGSRNAVDFRTQLTSVLARHGSRLPRTTRRAALASIDVNVALASLHAGASSGSWVALAKAGLRVLRLGAPGIVRFFRDTRIVERTLPRLRLRAAGKL